MLLLAIAKHPPPFHNRHKLLCSKEIQQSKDMHKFSRRTQDILRTLVERYIRDGQPVGSQAIVRDLPFSVSAATVRNIMAELEGQGLIRSPHTSAGRVPTALGYRMFVDSLVTWSPMQDRDVSRVRKVLGPDKSSKELVESASRMLSELTSMAGIVLTPRQERAVLRQVEFLPLQGNRALVILVLNDKEVQNRIIQMPRTFSEAELQEAAHYLNQRYAGVDLLVARQRILGDMRDDKSNMDMLMSAALDVAAEAASPGPESGQCVVSGETNLLPIASEQGVDRLRELFEAFQQKKDLLSLMDGCLNADGVQIFIGQEAGFQVLEDCSVITAPYTADNGLVGVLAVIGPTRMPYQRVVPMVDLTAKILGAALKSEE
ncbi:Negative regulator of class I heat shock protein [gamma proteobacterium HdN1]|nr:Negative regulator of class I heat shock protein [gamma proteobacterium HdN1]